MECVVPGCVWSVRPGGVRCDWKITPGSPSPARQAKLSRPSLQSAQGQEFVTRFMQENNVKTMLGVPVIDVK